MTSGDDRSDSQGPSASAWGRRSFVQLGAASAALAAGAWIGRGTAEEDVSPVDVGPGLAARLAEAHDPRDYGAYWNDASRPIGAAKNSTGSRGPYLSLTDAQRDFPWITALTNEWDWVGLVAASATAGEVQGILRLPPGDARIDQMWRPPDGVSIFGAGIGNTVLHLVGNGSVAVAELTQGYRHGYVGDFTVEASATSASPAVAVGLLVESVCGPVRVTGAPKDGVVIANAQNCEFWSWQVANCGGDGLVIDGGAMNLEFSNATVKGNKGSNIMVRRSDLDVPSHFSQVPRLIRFRGGLSEDVGADGSDCFRITAGIDITLDGAQTSVGEGRPSSASVRLERVGPNALQLIRLRAVQFKADDGVGLSIRGAESDGLIHVFISEANFRTGTSAVESDDGALIQLDSYFRTADVPRLFSHLGGVKQVDQILAGDSPVVLPASRATPTLGAPRLSEIDGHPMWIFDAAAEASISFVEFVPATWERFDVQLWWTGLGSNGDPGEVAWQLSHRFQTGTTVARDLEDGPVIADALPAPPEIAITTLVEGLADSGGIYTVRVTRVASDERDTAQEPAALYALVLRRS